MEIFLTRVELLQEPLKNKPDYSLLNEEMLKVGFLRTISDPGGKTYHLPTAEFYIKGDYSYQKVLLMAKDAVSITGCKSYVVVTHAETIAWDGLPQI